MTYPPFAVRSALVKRDCRRTRPAQVEEIVAVADAGQTRLLLGGGETRQIVDRLGLEPANVAARRHRSAALSLEIRWGRDLALDQAILAEGLPVEEHRRTKT